MSAAVGAGVLLAASQPFGPPPPSTPSAPLPPPPSVPPAPYSPGYVTPAAPAPRASKPFRRRTALLALALALVLAASGITGWVLLQLPSASGTPMLLLNEVLFDPGPGVAPFVELKNAGTAPAPMTGVALRTETGTIYSVPAGIAAVPPGGFQLIVFDGGSNIGGGIVHADRTPFLTPDSGSLLLGQNGVWLDRVAWGLRELDGVRLGEGGIVLAPPGGTTIGRYPGSTAIAARLDWGVYPSQRSTPGAANARQPVTLLLPFSGASYENLVADLSWYPVPGATTYRVQLASSLAFENPILDTTVRETGVEAGVPSPGTYAWRVQAGYADGAAEFSAPNNLSMGGPAPVSRGEALPEIAGSLPNFPLVHQGKDTSLLLLEEQDETDGHAWDRPLSTSRSADPADGNCGFAAIVEVNHFFGGSLSQDRLSYEAFKDRIAGPERDFQYGDGLPGNIQDRLMRFAFGGSPINVRGPAVTPDGLWANTVREIDAGRPILLTYAMDGGLSSHEVVIYGYRTVGANRILEIADSAWPRFSEMRLLSRFEAPAVEFWMLGATSFSPRFDDLPIYRDADGDGMMDFDETERFHTDPARADTDGDGLKDKDDVRTWIFDRDWGYAKLYNAAVPSDDPVVDHEAAQRAALEWRFVKDLDGDGRPMELDPDSDDGGCLDGREDRNQDGHQQAPDEGSNFDASDDSRCFPKGTGQITERLTSSEPEGTGFALGVVDITDSEVLYYHPNPAPGGVPLDVIVQLRIVGNMTWSFDMTGTISGTTIHEWMSCQVPVEGELDFAHDTTGPGRPPTVSFQAAGTTTCRVDGTISPGGGTILDYAQVGVQTATPPDSLLTPGTCFYAGFACGANATADLVTLRFSRTVGEYLFASLGFANRFSIQDVDFVFRLGDGYALR